MGACPEDEKPILPRHSGDSSPPEADACATCLAISCLSVLILASIMTLIWYITQSTMSLEYSVVITAVSGLNPATDLHQGRGVLNPVSNLTVGVASHSSLYGGCIEPGTSIRVSYSHLRLPMAGGRAPDMRVGQKQSVEPRPAVARGHDVVLPGFLVDSLAEDMRRGEAMFEVKLTGLNSKEGQWKTVTCWVRVGNTTGAALNMLWTETWSDIYSMPEGEFGYVPQPVPAAGPH